MVHVLNAPSPAATASISIGRTIADMALKELGGGSARRESAADQRR
jgi:L-2-hydroxyglutarate oxidase